MDWTTPWIAGAHRHIQHLYGAWPLHEINPEDESSLVSPALKALDKRGDRGDSRLLSTRKSRTSPPRREGPHMHTSRRFAARLTATASATFLAAAGLALVPAGDASAAGAPQGGHVYTLTAANSGKNAAVLGDSLADGAAVVQKTVSGGPGQLWEAVDRGDGTFSLVNINSGKCMDQTGSTNAGTAIIQGTCNGASTQNWTFSGSAIVSARSGLCLDVSGGSTAEDHAIIQWTCKNTANQQWSLTERLRSASWGPAMVSGGQTFTEQTIRMVIHNNTSGAGLRIRLSNL
ncbi:RICIN domain-containing protein, partial [Streptomyces sp. NPDC005474]|uniref:RICIN domain-containing protein n=1 Tax=Streptomyces sp. NPDC005474 TaxID=3154878 RepID=UPI0034546451